MIFLHYLETCYERLKKHGISGDRGIKSKTSANDSKNGYKHWIEHSISNGGAIRQDEI